MVEYTEVIKTQGIVVPFDPRIITPKIERPMRNNRYEGGECATLRRVLRPGDRVLELGAGVGLCSTVAALVEGVERVVAIEANPDLIPLIAETHRLNGVAPRIDLRNGVATPTAQGEIDFYLRPDFWASSMEPGSRAYDRVVRLPTIGLDALIAELRPTVLVCDIEGGEEGLFDRLDLSSVRHLVLELHPKVYGEAGAARVAGTLAAKGLTLDEDNRVGSSVQLFARRPDGQPPMKGSRMPARAYRDWPMPDPRVLVTTCMKDEGPFILEWLAWHKAMGVSDVVVFTNDCTDGTDRLLDRLHAMGEVTHLPNPALAVNSPAFQPIALAYTHFLPAFRAADLVISMDVDEFINVRVGAGRLADLFAATGPFDALSMTELNHGANGQIDFTPGSVRAQFPAHETQRPGHYRARRGVKTITRLSPRVERIRNHRPDFVAGGLPPLWLDGAGRFTRWFDASGGENGHDCRGSYDLVSLEHYPLRSLGSFFVKTLRGDVVVANKSVSLRYWRMRNRNEVTTSRFNPAIEAAAADYAQRRFAGDATLMALHQACCDHHRARIDEIAHDPAFVERRAWIMANAWDTPPEAEAAGA